MSVEELFHDTFEAGHAGPLQLGVADDYPQGVWRGLGFHLERAALGEEDVGEHGLGGYGEVAQSAAAQAGHGAQPGDEVAGLASAGKLRWELFFVRRSIHEV